MDSQLDISAIETAAGILRKGGLVAFPTETVYGLGANALDPVAVARIFELKERPVFDPLIVHIASVDMLDMLTISRDERVQKLAEHFWPGPLTMVLPKSDSVPDIVSSGLPTVGIRMPAHNMALELIRRAGCPVAAPSANKFGRLSPTTASHVRKQLPGVDFVLDGGKTTVGIESTIIAIEGNECRILRPGRITAADIQLVIPEVVIVQPDHNDKILAPGTLKSHYSPRKPLYLLQEGQTLLPDYSGLILHGTEQPAPHAYKIIYTSQTHQLPEISAGLFSALHSMEDDPEIRQIFIQPVEEKGLGIAVMDRIRKAAYQYQKK